MQAAGEEKLSTALLGCDLGKLQYLQATILTRHATCADECINGMAVVGVTKYFPTQSGSET